MRRLVAVLSVTLALGACATAERPALRPSSTNCSEKVCLFLHPRSGGFDVRIENRFPVAVTASVNFPLLDNLEVSQTVLLEGVVPAGRTEEVAHLRPVDPREPTRVQAAIEFDLGSDATVHDDSVRYAFPFGGDEPRLLTQGVDGARTHRGPERYAFDFDMPEGTPVLAARGGTVVRVRDGFSRGGLDEELKERGNHVVIAHDDGTLAFYGHLSGGTVVRVDERVRVGDLLARSGNTGYSAGPHLHFHVGKRAAGRESRTIPIRFIGASPVGVVPVEGRYYGPGRQGG